MTLRVGLDRERRDASLAFHLGAGVDAVAVWAAPDDSSARADLQELPLDDRVCVAPPSTSTSRSTLMHWAVDELNADWLIEVEPDEFWWPRFGSISDSLQAVPPGSNAAQGVVRTLLPSSPEGPFEERFTLRLSPRAPSIDPTSRLFRRFARRASALDTDPSDLDVFWGYYPFEVLSLSECAPVDAAEARVREALELGVVAPDERLRNVMRRLRAGMFTSTGERLEFSWPDPIEDAVFALEAAALDDLELALARQRLDAIAQRLSTIETSRLLLAESTVRRAVRRLKRTLARPQTGP